MTALLMLSLRISYFKTQINEVYYSLKNFEADNTTTSY